MQTCDIRLDGATFSRDAIVAATHRYSGRFNVSVSKDGDDWLIRLASSDPIADVADLVATFNRDAVDEQLREAVRQQTSELHVALLEAALLGARQKPPGH